MTASIRLYATPKSGHCHRVELFLRILGLEYEWVEAPASVRATEAFAALNPLRQIPVLTDGEATLADSNAILVYLAKRYDAGGPWLPEDPLGAATVQRWLSIAAGELRFGPAAARAAALFGAPADPATVRAVSGQLLRFMEDHLAGRDWLAAERPTLADIACYAYVAHAPEGGISLADCPAVRDWLRRVEALPAFKPLPASPLPTATAGA
jgi:glutathione S-transferase